MLSADVYTRVSGMVRLAVKMAHVVHEVSLAVTCEKEALLCTAKPFRASPTFVEDAMTPIFLTGSVVNAIDATLPVEPIPILTCTACPE